MRRFVGLLVCAACADGSAPLDAPPPSDAGEARDAGVPDAGRERPRIGVLPRVLSFGLTTRLAPTRRSLLVHNVGFDPLEVRTAVLDEAAIAAGFALDAPALPARLEPGDLLELTLELRMPYDAPVEGRLTILSDDPIEPQAHVRLLAEGTDCCPCRWRLAPDAIDFGPTSTSTPAEASVFALNDSDRACLIDVARDPECSPAFTVEGPQPLRLAPTASVAVAVRFAPADEGRQSCTLSLRDGHIFGGGHTLTLTGAGVR